MDTQIDDDRIFTIEDTVDGAVAQEAFPEEQADGIDNLGSDYDNCIEEPTRIIRRVTVAHAEPEEIDDLGSEYGDSVYRTGSSVSLTDIPVAKSVRLEVNVPFEDGPTDTVKLYCGSPRGKELTRALSAIYGALIIMIGVSLKFSYVLGADSVDFDTCKKFYIYMHVVSSVFIITFLILGARNKLTRGERYKDQKNVTFLRIGATILGTGGIIYQSTKIVTYITCTSECEMMELIEAITSIVFTMLEITMLLNYSKVHINKGIWLSLAAEFMSMHIIATNISTWVQTVVLETVEEISHATTNSKYSPGNEFEQDEDTVNGTTESESTIQSLLAPILFPLMIEYSVVAATMVVAIWERCGIEEHNKIQRDLDQSFSSSRRSKDRRASIQTNLTNLTHISDYSGGYKPAHRSDASTSNASNTVVQFFQKKRVYYNSHLGFVVGWIVICASTVVVLVYLFVTYSEEEHSETMETVAYSFDMSIKLICLITLPVTIYKMSVLTTKDPEIKALRTLRRHNFLNLGHHIHRELDKTLIIITVVALMAFNLFLIISAVEMDVYVIFANGVISIIMASFQSVFIVWYGFNKRASKEVHLQRKPGRQCLEVLRCCNLAIWAVNSFIVKHPSAKRVPRETFGLEAWVILSNIMQPFAILFYFHGMICLAEIITHTYTDKYLGIKRYSKVTKTRSAEEEPDTMHTEL